MRNLKKRIKELEKEIKNDEKALTDIIQEMKTLEEKAQLKMRQLQTKAAGIDKAITSRKGGLLELENISKEK